MASIDAQVTLKWANGRHTFRLGWGELIMLQEECNAGPFEILMRFSRGNWRVQEISNVIRLGLIGGGLPPAEALTLVEKYVEARPPLENLVFARGILGVAVQGNPDEQPGKDPAAQDETEAEQPNA